jgi:hypothetical protein
MDIIIKNSFCILLFLTLVSCAQTTTTSSGIPCSMLKLDAHLSNSSIQEGSNVTIFYTLWNNQSKDEDAQNITIRIKVPDIFFYPDNRIHINKQNNKTTRSGIILESGRIALTSYHPLKVQINATTVDLDLDSSGLLKVFCSRLDPQCNYKFNLTTIAKNDDISIPCSSISIFNWERPCNAERFKDIDSIRSTDVSTPG